MNKGKSIKKIALLLATTLSLAACKEAPEFGELKVPEEKVETTQSEYDKQLGEEQQVDRFEISEEILKGDTDIAEKTNKQVVDNIKSYAEVVKLPKDIKSLAKNSDMIATVSDEEAVQIAKIRKPVMQLDEDSAQATWSDAVTITTKTEDLNTKEDMSYVDVKTKQVRLGNQDINDKLEEKIIGMKVNETKKFIISYPGDYYDREFQGKTIATYVKVFQIARADEPTPEEIAFVKADVGEIKANNYYSEMHKDLKAQITEKVEIKAYPKKVIDELRQEYRNIYLSEENKEQITKNSKELGEEPNKLKESEDLYVLENIEKRLILLALSEQTGIDKDSSLVKAYMDDRYMEEISDDELFDIILDEALR